MDIREIDTKQIFEDYDIDIKESGKNVSRGWVNIHCPFPECSDPSTHCGINLTSNLFNCWICGQKGSIIKLLKIILEKSYHEVLNIVKRYTFEGFDELEEEQKKIIKVELPKECTKSMPNMAYDYLAKRGFDPIKISSKYKLRFCRHLGDYNFRIIVPIYEKGKLVSFTSRDYTEKSPIAWMHDLKGSMEGKLFLYDVDSVKNRALIVEGCPDKWRMGNETIGTFGTAYTKEQVLKIARLGLELAIVLFDHEKQAQEKAKKLALDIEPYVEKTKVVDLYDDVYPRKKDPAEMFSDEEAEKIKLSLFEEEK